MADDGADLENILPAAHAGSPEALGAALEACRLYLLAVAERALDDNLRAKAGASDIVQETFLEAQRDFARFHGQNGAELRAWLRRLLVNNLSNFARHYRDTDKRRLDREIFLDPTASASRVGPVPAADGPTPSQQVVVDEEEAELDAAIERLPEDYRILLRMRYREERSFEEIAAALNRSNNAVRKLWARALQRLEDELEGRS